MLILDQLNSNLSIVVLTQKRQCITTPKKNKNMVINLKDNLHSL